MGRFDGTQRAFFIATFRWVDGDDIVSPKHSSLAFDEYVKEYDRDQNFEPELKVIVNAHYARPSFSMLTSDDVVQVKGRITVSF